MDHRDFEKEYSRVYSLGLLIRELHQNSKKLYSLACDDYTFDYPQLELAKLYSDFSTFQAATYILDEAHYDITSYLSFWKQFYIQLSEVILKNDRNVSWLNSSFNQIDGQFNIVDKMLSDYLTHLKG